MATGFSGCPGPLACGRGAHEEGSHTSRQVVVPWQRYRNGHARCFGGTAGSMTLKRACFQWHYLFARPCVRLFVYLARRD